jgi:predicted nucleic acid-binding protein
VTFDQIPAGTAVFLDANSLVYHFTNDPRYGVASTRFVRQIEQGALAGFTSTDVLADVAHRLMTLEAIGVNGWPYAGIAARLRKHHHSISMLTIFRQAITSLPQLNVQVIPITQALLEAATLVSQQFDSSPATPWLSRSCKPMVLPSSCRISRMTSARVRPSINCIA